MCDSYNIPKFSKRHKIVNLKANNKTSTIKMNKDCFTTVNRKDQDQDQYDQASKKYKKMTKDGYLL